MQIKQLDYKTISINGNQFILPQRIRQIIELNEQTIVIRIGSKKSDKEFEIELTDGYIYFMNEDGITGKYNNLSICNLWKIDENTLGMYDGQSDLWLDVNKKEIVRMIWNPWGLDNPEKYK